MGHLIILFLFEFTGNLDKHLHHIVLGKLWAFSRHSIQPDGTTGPSSCSFWKVCYLLSLRLQGHTKH